MDRKILALYRPLAFMFVLVFANMNLYAQTTYFSRSPSGNWNSATTWSTVTYDNGTNLGTFPIAGDFVFIGGAGSIVTITGAAAFCATIDIANNSTLNVGQGLTVSGTTTVGSGSSGVLAINSAAGTKLFAGPVTINSGGLWNETVVEPITFQGGIDNDNGGTFTATTNTAVHTFNTTSQALTGTFIIPSVAVGGGATVLTNTNSLTVNTALTGGGRITQGASATLNIGGTSTITNMTATATGNTVNYTGANQTIKNVAYENLTLSGSGVPLLQVGTTLITGDLILSSATTLSTSAVIGLNIDGDVNIGVNTTFTAGAFTHNVAGDWTNNGTFNGTSSTINFDGAGQTISDATITNGFNNVTLAGSGTKILGASTTIAGAFSISSGVVADLGANTTHTANTLLMGGAIQPSGIWGGTASGSLPARTNDIYFLSSSIGEITIASGAFSYYSRLSGDWNNPITWSTVSFGSPTNIGTYPQAGDVVNIGGGFIVTLTGPETTGTLSFDAGTNVTNTLDLSGNTLTITGAVTIPQMNTSGANILAVGSGTLNAGGSISFTNGSAGGTGHRLTISTGTTTVTGNVTGTGTSSTIQFTGAGLLQLAGTFYTPALGTLTTSLIPNSRVEYNGAAQTVTGHTYRNLILTGNTKNLGATTTISGDLSIADATTFTVGGFNLTVAGTTTVGGGASGNLTISSNAGAKQFTGLVTIAAGATWDNTGNESIVFRGGITKNATGTFNAGTLAAVHTFNTTPAQTLTGVFVIPSVTVTAPTILTNNGTLTVTNALAGNGNLTQGASSTLFLGGTSTITTLTANAGTNIVEYNGTAQTVRNSIYRNLSLSGTAPTLQAGTTSILGNLDLSVTVSVTGVIGLTIGGNVTIGSGTTFTAGNFTHNVAGNWTNNGTFIGTGSIINFNGAGQTITDPTLTLGFTDVTLSGSGTKVFGASTIISGGLSINSGAVADLFGITTHTASTLTLGGVLQIATGTWGFTGSGATNINAAFVNSGRITTTIGGNNYYSRANTDWNTNTTWSNVGFGGTAAATAPGATDLVFIGGGNAVTLAGAATCGALSFDAGVSVTNSLTIGGAGNLNVSGAVTIPRAQTVGFTNRLAVDTGTLTAGDIDFTVPGNAGGQLVRISSGMVTVSGNVTGIGASSTIQFTGAGSLLLGGAIYTPALGTLTTFAGSTVQYNGTGAQTVQGHTYRNLTLSGGNTKTLGGNTTLTGATSNLVIADATTFNVAGFNLTVGGTTTVGGGTSGTLAFVTSNTGAKTFTGSVTIAAGASWINNNIIEAVTFSGGITNSGTFTAGTGVYTFATNPQTLTSSSPISIANITVTGVVLTNNSQLSVGTALSGVGGTLRQGTNAILNIGAASAITTMDATTNTPNTVNYTGAAQTVNTGNYVNLGLSGSGIKTLQVGTTSIAGNLILTGTATTGVIGLTIGGNVDIGAGTTFTSGAFVHNVAGNWTKNATGTFTGTGSTINFNGAGQSILGATTTFNDVILAGTGTKIFGVQTTIVGGLSISNTSIKADLGIINSHSANTLTLGGELQPFPSTTWGSILSGAAHTDDTFFLSTSSGRVNIALGGNNYYSVADGAWNSAATWSTTNFGGLGGDGVPGANDFVFIGTNGGGTRTVNVDVAASCSALSFDAGTATSLLTIDPTFSLAVSGAVTIPQGVSGANTLAVATGTLTAGDIDFTTSGVGSHQLTISTGTATVSGNVTGIGASSTISFSGGGLLRLGGLFYTPALGTLTTGGVGAVEYFGASAQTVQAHNYQNLTLSGGTKTLNAATTIGGILAIANSTTFNVGAFPLTVTGATNVGTGTGGNLTISSPTGAKIFTGLVTINPTATWNNSGNSPVTLRGGIANSGTFTAGTGVYTFDANTPVLTGLLTIPSVTVTGVTLTNNGTLTTNTALAGVGGTLLQGTGATLNIGGTSAIATIDATTNTPNTVNYTGAAQTIKNVSYSNLGLSGSGIKTFQTPTPTTSIAGNLTLSGTVSTTGLVGLTIGGNMSIGAGTTFIAGAFTHNVAGNWVNNGTFNNSNATIVFNGGASAQTVSGASNTLFNNITVNNTAGVTLSSAQRLNGLLSFGAGTVFNANGNLTLLSTAVNHAASIGNLTGITFTGNVTVQRFFGTADNTDRFISAPISNATVAQIQASTPVGNFPVTGGFTGTSFPCTGCTNDGHNLRYYNEPDAGTINSGYKSWITSTTNTLVPGLGYDAFMWNGVSNTTVNFTGTINQGVVLLGSVPGSPTPLTPITFTNNTQPFADGWNLVGNPYPSAILWDQSVAAGWTKANINDYVYVYDVAAATWRYKDFASATGTLSGPLNGEIASGQGFWVYTASPTATLQVNEAAKSSSTTASYYRTSSNPVDRVKISLRSLEGPSTDDIFLFAGSTNKNTRDGFKPELGFEPISMSFMVEDVKYGFYVQKNTDQSIPVYVKIKNEGNYEFSFTSEGNASELEDYYLVDTYLSKSEKAISGANYSFGFTTAQAAMSASRFYLTKNPELLLEGTEKVVQVSCFPNPTAGEMSIEINSEDVQNVSIINSTGISFQGSIDLKSSNGITSGKVDLNNLSPGIYMIRGYSKGKVFTEKVIKY